VIGLHVHDPLALLWVASSAALLIVSGSGVRESVADMRLFPHNGRREVAKERLVMQLGRAVIGLLWLAVGIPVLFDEPVTPLNGGVVALLASNGILTSIAAYSRWKRLQLLRLA
jgi:hypothetical protein